MSASGRSWSTGAAARQRSHSQLVVHDGGELGLAVVASILATRAGNLLASGHDRLVALDGGYHVAFAAGAGFALLAACLSALLQRPARPLPSLDTTILRLDDVDPVGLSRADPQNLRRCDAETEPSAPTFMS